VVETGHVLVNAFPPPKLTPATPRKPTQDDKDIVDEERRAGAQQWMVFIGRVLLLVLAFFINLLPLALATASTSTQHKHKPRSAFLVHTPRFTKMSSSSSSSTPTTSLSAKSNNAAAAPPPPAPPSCQASYPLGPEGTLPMPAVGLGTFQVKEETGYEAVKAAIKVKNEKVGVCLRAFVRINRLPALPVSWAGARSLALNASQSIVQDGH